MATLQGVGTAAGESGVQGEAAEGAGVVGLSHAAGQAGIVGVNDNRRHQRVSASMDEAPRPASSARARTWHGVFGRSESTTGGHGVRGEGGVGVSGLGSTWIGVYGETNAAAEAGAAAVWGDGKATGDGVKGVATGAGKASRLWIPSGT